MENNSPSPSNFPKDTAEEKERTPRTSEECLTKLLGEDVCLELIATGAEKSGLNYSGIYRGSIEFPPGSGQVCYVLEDGEYFSKTITLVDGDKESDKISFDRAFIPIREARAISQEAESSKEDEQEQ